MVTRLRFQKLEFVGLFALIIVIMIVMGKYYYKPIWQIIEDSITGLHTVVVFKDNYHCGEGQKKILVPGGNLCRVKVVDVEPFIPVTGSIERPASNYLTDTQLIQLFDTYPLHGEGREVILGFMDEGDVEKADSFLNDYYSVDRYEPFKIKGLPTWTEDPYKDVYWRFLFYSLRPTNDLLYAYRKTGNPIYKDKLLEILNSFLDEGMDQKTAWEDPHSVAFRTMVLINDWWKLRELNVLPIETSNKLLRALQVHGDYLLADENYQAKYNHGLNQGAALYLLAVNFPSFPQANTWLQISETRLKSGITDIVDEDGSLIENSPYYHFYALEKIWEISQYSKKHNLSLHEALDPLIQKMVNFGMYILQPDLKVPLIGASLERTLYNNGIEADIALTNPTYEFVLTRGENGIPPPATSINFASAGQTILRSAWGDHKSFTTQTQVVMNVGEYRSDHNHYDALGINLYGNGTTLLTDAGLYTYDEGKYLDYFKGTRAHNTVVVDGKTQEGGKVYQGTFYQGDGYSFQTAAHTLYEGVTHNRAVVLVGKNLVLIVDQLTSKEEHSYEQMFHLAPETQLVIDGLTVTGKRDNLNQIVSIHQLENDSIKLKTALDQKEPLDGICSIEYGKTVPCYSIAYSKYAKSTRYVTLIEIGTPTPNRTYRLTEDGQSVLISDEKTNLTVSLSLVAGIDAEVSVNKGAVPAIPEKIVEDFGTVADWKMSNSGSSGLLESDSLDHPHGVNSLKLTSPSDGESVRITKEINWDLTDKNFLLGMKVLNAVAVKELSLEVTSDNWENYASTRLENSYSPDYSGAWLNISLAKGYDRRIGGQWTIHGDKFTWSAIRKIRFKLQAIPTQTVVLFLDKIALTPAPYEGSVTIIFDDGSASIRPAIDLFRDENLRGNIAVISKNVSDRKASYLSLRELSELQNNDNWDILNHTWYHLNAIENYYPDKLDQFEKDMLMGEKYLIRNGINSNPNWFIYPDGATNEAIKEIVGKYYIFARTVRSQPEAFYPGDNLQIKALSVGDSISAEEVCSVLVDTRNYKLTQFLTFHRIYTEKDPRGYKLEELKKIINCIKDLGVKVKTVSDLDHDFGITPATIKFTEAVPELIQLNVTVSPVKPRSFWALLIDWFKGNMRVQR
jgi:peptidoglycan/xylan/chitin deacetylase (PgdA/CDA1 family)